MQRLRPHNRDLAPDSSETRCDDLSMQRAFTQAQLLIYRTRDNCFLHDPSINEALSNIAEEIGDLASKWHWFNQRQVKIVSGTGGQGGIS